MQQRQMLQKGIEVRPFRVVKCKVGPWSELQFVRWTVRVDITLAGQRSISEYRQRKSWQVRAWYPEALASCVLQQLQGDCST